MATVTKDFRVKAGLVVEGSTATVNGHDILTEALVDAKGDILVASAADTVARLGVGTNGQVLTAASGATYGLEWAAPAAVGEFASSITFEGSTANDFETTVAVTDPTADRTITFPDATGTVALTGDITSAIDALDTDDIEEGSTNQYFTSQRALDATSSAYDAAGSAAAAQSNAEDYADGLASNYEVSGAVSTHSSLTTGVHGVTGDVVGTSDAQTLTNKTLTSPKINEDVAVTATATELNVLDGITSSTSELNLLDGVTATTTEINYIDGVTSAIQTQLNDKLALAGGTMTGAIAMGTNKITGLGTPTDSADAATKAYVDGVAQGLDVKASVVTASEDNVDIAAFNAATDSIGGVSSLVSGNRVLLKNQTVDTENGIYVLDATNDLIRASDATVGAGGTLTQGSFTFVESGTNAGKGFVVSLYFDPDGVYWSQFSESGQYITSVSSPLDVTSGTLSITADTFESFGTTGTHSDLTTGVHGVTGDVVGTSDTQTLSNKYIAGYLGFYNDISEQLGSIGTGDGNFSIGAENTFLIYASTGDITISPAIDGAVYINEATASNEVATIGNLQDGDSTATPEYAGISLPDALLGSATATAGTSATTIDQWSPSTYSAAKYVVQLKKSGNIEVIEILVAIDGSNNVYLTEYANVQSNGELGTTDAVYLSGPGEVALQVTAAAEDTSVKISKTYIEA